MVKKVGSFVVVVATNGKKAIVAVGRVVVGGKMVVEVVAGSWRAVQTGYMDSITVVN